MNIKSLAAFALLASAAIAPAQAGNFVFHYDQDATASDAGSVVSADLLITTSDTTNSAGLFDIVGVTGTVDGNAVDTLYPNPNSPSPDSTQFDHYIFDNQFGPGARISENGILIGSGSMLYNIGYLGPNDTFPDYYILSSAVGAPGSSILGSFGHASLAAVPEPASWAMMLTGFGLAGMAMRRRRATVSFA